MDKLWNPELSWCTCVPYAMKAFLVCFHAWSIPIYHVDIFPFYSIYDMCTGFVLKRQTMTSESDADTFLYFAYGSNLSKARIHINNPSAEFVSIAKLKVGIGIKKQKTQEIQILDFFYVFK